METKDELLLFTVYWKLLNAGSCSHYRGEEEVWELDGIKAIQKVKEVLRERFDLTEDIVVQVDKIKVESPNLHK